MRIVVSGGGTAGHISPTLATCDALKSLEGEGLELLYIGQEHGMEARIVAASGLAFASIRAGKFRRDHFAGTLAKIMNLRTFGPNTRDAFRAVAGVADALKILRDFKPDVVFIKGGFVGVPVGLAAKLLRIPYVIHESDVVPGLANRLLGKWATKIAVGFPVKNYHDFDAARLVSVGNPIRPDIARAKREDGIKHFGLQPDLPTLMITGGSQGAAQINDLVVAALPELLEICQVLHITGEGEYARLEFERSRRPQPPRSERYHPQAFLMNMGEALAAADVVISRAGVNAITDAAVLGKATVLIPNYQMAGHQVENARVLSRMGAVRVLDGQTATPEKLVREVKRLISDEDERMRLGTALRQFVKPQAAHDLAAIIVAVGRGEQHA